MKKSHMEEQELELYMSVLIPWEELEGRTILIAGATGMIGAALTRILLHRNHRCGSRIRILALSRSRDSFERVFAGAYEEEELIFCEADLGSGCSLFPLKGQVDFIIHAASDADPASFAGHPVEVMKTNFIGLDQLLTYAVHWGARRVLYLSSGEIYGQSVEGRIFDEGFCGYVDLAKPRSCYPSAKRAAEVLCQSYSQEYGLNVVIARPCHIYGPDMRRSDSRVVAQFIWNATDGRTLVMKSEGLQQRSMCYAYDCAEALLTILLKGERGGAYNIAGEDAVISIRQLADLISEIAHVPLRLEIPTEAEKRSYNTVEKSILDWHKIYGLGWRPKRDIAEGIKRTIEIMKERVG